MTNMKSTTILTLALALAACARHDAPTPIATAVELAPVREESRGSATRYPATVEPDAQVAIAFRVSLYVDAITVEEGDRVAKGSVLVRIRTADYEQEARPGRGIAGRGAAALAQAKSDLARAEALFAANAMTRPEIDAAIARVDINQALSSAAAADDEAGLALRHDTLVAPIDGVILRRNIERGDLGQPSATAFVLADTRAVKVTFGAIHDDRRAAEWQHDRRHHRVDARPHLSWTRGARRTVSRSENAQLRRRDPHRQRRERAQARHGRVDRSRPAGRAAVDHLLDAIVRDPKSRDAYAVYVVEDGRATALRFDLGEPVRNLVALRSGERVVVSGPALLIDGQKVPGEREGEKDRVDLPRGRSPSLI